MMHFLNPTWPINSPRRWQNEAFAATQTHFAGSKEAAVISAIMGAGKSLLIQELCACCELEHTDRVIVVSTSTQDLVESLATDIKRRCHMKRTVGMWYGKRKRMAEVIVACVDSLPTLATQLNELGKNVWLWIADECHRSECSTVLNAQETLKPWHALGLTATPFRSSDFEAITLFKKLIYRYGVKEAQFDNVVVPWRIVNFDGEEDELDEACARMIKDAAGPGLANAVDIADAEAFAKLLTSRGIPSKAVHSRQSQAQKQRTIEDLKAGRLRCAVHVNLLTEGANFPWLCWLLLRREVDSRVRFCQEIGRALRACYEPIWGAIKKEEAVFYDPHDLFGSFSLSYAEALGEPPEKPDGREIERMPPEEISERIHSADPPVAMAWIESAVRTLTVACDSVHLMGNRKLIKKADRLKPSNRMQQVAIQSAVDKIREIAPEGWLKLLAEIIYRPECVRFGFAADLLVALASIAASKRWPPLDSRGRISSVPGAEEAAPESPLSFSNMTRMAGQLELDFEVV